MFTIVLQTEIYLEEKLNGEQTKRQIFRFDGQQQNTLESTGSYNRGGGVTWEQPVLPA
jgi:hypothetical protein